MGGGGEEEWEAALHVRHSEHQCDTMIPIETEKNFLYMVRA